MPTVLDVSWRLVDWKWRNQPTAFAPKVSQQEVEFLRTRNCRIFLERDFDRMLTHLIVHRVLIVQ